MIAQMLANCEWAVKLDNGSSPYRPMFGSERSFPSCCQLNEGMLPVGGDLAGVHMDSTGVPFSLMLLAEVRGRIDGRATALAVQNRCDLIDSGRVAHVSRFF